MKPATKKVFKWAFGLTALFILVPFMTEETLFRAAMGAIGGGMFALIFYGIFIVAKWVMKVSRVWAKWIETDSTTGSDKKEPTIKKRTNLEYTTSTEKTTTPKNPSYESMVPKKAKEFEHDNSPDDGIPTIKIFCTQCGIKNQSDAKFCWKCGHAMHFDEAVLIKSIRGFNADQFKIKEKFKSLMNIIIIIVLAGVATMLGKIAVDAWQSSNYQKIVIRGSDGQTVYQSTFTSCMKSEAQSAPQSDHSEYKRWCTCYSTQVADNITSNDMKHFAARNYKVTPRMHKVAGDAENYCKRKLYGIIPTKESDRQLKNYIESFQ